MKVMLAIFPSLEFIENTFGKWAKALGAYKAVWMPKLSIGVNNFFMWFKPVITTNATRILVHFTGHLKINSRGPTMMVRGFDSE